MPRQPYRLTESDYPHALAYFERIASDLALENPRKFKALKSARDSVPNLQDFIDTWLSQGERSRMLSGIRKRRSRSSSSRSNADHRVALDEHAADLLRRVAGSESLTLSDTIRRYLPTKSPPE